MFGIIGIISSVCGLRIEKMGKGMMVLCVWRLEFGV